MSVAQGLIFCTHAEILARKPHFTPESGEPTCAGRMVAIDTELEVWTVRCDECGLEIGVPPRQWKPWLQGAS